MSLFNLRKPKLTFWIHLTDSKTGETRVDRFFDRTFAAACIQAKYQYSNFFNPKCRIATLRDRYSSEYFDESGKLKKSKTVKKATKKQMSYKKTTYRKKSSSSRVPAKIYSKLSARSKNEIKRVISGKPVRKTKRKATSKGLFGLGFFGL